MMAAQMTYMDSLDIYRTLWSQGVDTNRSSVSVTGNALQHWIDSDQAEELSWRHPDVSQKRLT